MRPRAPAGIAFALALSALPVCAQGTTATVRVNLPVTNAVSVLNVSPFSTDFGMVGSAQLAAGVVQAAGPTVRVRSNRPFAVTMAAGTATFGPAAKPASDVRWSLSSGGSYTALSTSPTTVFTSPTGAVMTQALHFRMTVGLATDLPGSYPLALSVTLTAP
jgi:hypothetical protein